MTYRQVLDELREELIWLLTRHRIQQAIGASASGRPATSTDEERRGFGIEIQRYRGVILRYALLSLETSNPTARLTTIEIRREPMVALQYELTRATRDLPMDPALSDLMNHTPKYPLIGHWQDATRAAVQAERELAHLPWHQMTPERLRVIHKDAADITRAIAILEARYINTPGWTVLPRRTRLQRSADHARRYLADLTLDHTADNHGWRPRPGRIEGPALPGLAGVVQAQHNVLVGLMEFPNAMNLRRILADQAQLSARVAAVAAPVDGGIAAHFEARSRHYRELMLAARTVGGEIGRGRDAALESSYAASRLPARLSAVDRGTLERLLSLSGRVDGRVRAAIEHGFDNQLYLVATTVPEFDGPAVGGVLRGHTRWAPADQEPELLNLAHSRACCTNV